ncbi:hypothetical protein [Novosphingobium sp.]|uniref:hypothetical protein n=1 Tax=Novosphingobium sp. TaxID=1874826 RepID=UPI00352BD127
MAIIVSATDGALPTPNPSRKREGSETCIVAGGVSRSGVSRLRVTLANDATAFFASALSLPAALVQEARMADDPLRSNPPSDPAGNPVRRARAMVEAEVPPARRGPGWDRHWRELEAYVEAQAGVWTGAGAGEDPFARDD